VAATEEAHEEGTTLGRETTCLIDEVFLPDPHADMQPGLVGSRNEPEGDTLAVLEVSTASAMLRVVDAVLKRVPVQLSKLRLADDLGGKAVAFLDGELSDIQEAVAIANEQVTDTSGQMINASIMSRMDETLRKVLTESTTFGLCRNWTPAGAEHLED
jgi:microcompartment protein CcmL/EutN